MRTALHRFVRRARGRAGFTLMEINLAIFIMAVGVLAMIALYPLGFRESQQSRDDVASAALADDVINPLVAALTATNVTWSAWQRLPSIYPQSGWRSYFSNDDYSDTISGDSMSSLAQGTFSRVIDALGSGTSGITFPSGVSKSKSGLCTALVVARNGATLSIAVRATRRPGLLLAQPLYYTEVHFQGDPNK